MFEVIRRLAAASLFLAPYADVGAQPCAPAATDSVTLVVSATLRPFEATESLPEGYARQFLTEYANRLILPNPLAVPVYQGLDSSTASRMQDSAAGTTSIRFLAGVRLAGSTGRALRLMTSTLSPSLDSTFAGALQEMAGESAMPALPDGKQVEARLLILTDTVVPAGAVELFRMRSPRLVITAPTVARHVPPKYPPMLRSANIEGEVLVEFVIDERGALDAPSVRVLKMTHPEFLKAAMDVLPRFTFRPARAGACRVSYVVAVPMVFSLR